MYFTRHGYVGTAYYRCTNSACGSWHITQDVDVIEESDTGAKYLRYEQDRYCQDCGHEMEET
jgi:hypothetical protein